MPPFSVILPFSSPPIRCAARSVWFFGQKGRKLPPALFEFPQLLMSSEGSRFLFGRPLLAPNRILLPVCPSSFAFTFLRSQLFTLCSVSLCLIVSFFSTLPFAFSLWPDVKPRCIYRLAFLIPVQTTAGNDFLLGCAHKKNFKRDGKKGRNQQTDSRRASVHAAVPEGGLTCFFFL